jgi:hypothetical protein
LALALERRSSILIKLGFSVSGEAPFFHKAGFLTHKKLAVNLTKGERNIRPRGCELYIRKPYLLEELEMAFRQVLKSKLDANLKLH